MQFIKLKYRLLSLIFFSFSVCANADSASLDCPHPSQIQSTDFTVPSIWIAPPVAHSAPNTVGVGLGGKEVKEFLGAETTTVNHKPGWVCIYKTTGISARAFEDKVQGLVDGNRYLKQYQKKLTKGFGLVDPFLSKYPADEILGFVGYQRAKA